MLQLSKGNRRHSRHAGYCKFVYIAKRTAVSNEL